MGDKCLFRLADHQAHPRRVGLEPIAEALIGEVDERDEAAALDQFGDLGPLAGRKIGAGRIVAAAVEKDEVAGPSRLQRSHHLVEQYPPARRVVIRVRHHLDSGGRDQRAVVGPGRLADEDPRLRIGLADQIGREAKGAAAARSLEPDDPLVRRSGLAEQDRADQLGEAGIALRAQIGLGLLPLPEQPLRLLDGAQDRGPAPGIAIDSDSDVDLVRPRIGVAQSY